MKKVNHFTWSLALSVWIFYFYFEYNIFETIIFSLIVAMISWLPDIDIRIVNESRKLLKASFYLLLPIHFIVKTIFKHRTITHSLFIPIVLYLISLYLIENIYLDKFLIILSLSLFLHIFEDSLTVSGVKLFWPIPLKIRFAKFSTNSEVHFILLELIGYAIFFSFFGFIFI